MPITHIYSFLVHPAKGTANDRTIGGTHVSSSGKLLGLLGSIYDRSPLECEIDIFFRAADDGTQKNPCRDLLISHIEKPSLRSGRAIAQRLAEHTDRRPGIGLLFLILGQETRTKRLIISRFPTDQAILAEETGDTLSVSFLEQVFLKNRHSYKAVMYEDTSVRGGFWTGTAIDRQNTDFGRSFFSNYWIGDFLCSDLSTTPAAGTRRLGHALKDAAKKSDGGVKSEIIAAATLATGLNNKRISISEFQDSFNLSSGAREAIGREIKSSSASVEKFVFDAEVFREVIGFKSIELDNGGIMTALAGNFQEVFRSKRVASSDEIRFTTQGKIIEERLKRSSS